MTTVLTVTSAPTAQEARVATLQRSQTVTPDAAHQNAAEPPPTQRSVPPPAPLPAPLPPQESASFAASAPSDPIPAASAATSATADLDAAPLRTTAAAGYVNPLGYLKDVRKTIEDVGPTTIQSFRSHLHFGLIDRGGGVSTSDVGPLKVTTPAMAMMREGYGTEYYTGDGHFTQRHRHHHHDPATINEITIISD